MSERPDGSNGRVAPEVQDLLDEVQRRVEEKKAQGLYDPDELRRVEEAALVFAQPVEDGYEAAVNLHLDALRELWDAKVCAVETHRTGPAGRALLAVKRLVHRLSSFFLGVWLARQVKFNDALVKLLLELLPRHFELRQRMNHSERRLDQLEDLGRDLTASLADLTRRQESEMHELRRGVYARLDALEREQGKGRSELENLLARLQRIVEEQARHGAVSGQTARAVAAERARSRGAAYLAFEDLHRGSREEIKKRQAVYLPIFQKGVTPETPLLDIGCGRGEFLELCRENGLAARGVDLNPQMVAECRELDLEVAEGDALEYLRSLPDASLGGILAAQLIEHLTVDDLVELVSLCAAKLRPGGALVAETINPTCLTTFSGAFYLDLTHQKPIHPEAVRFLWQWAGLGEVEVLYLSPYPPEHRLEELPAVGGAVPQEVRVSLEAVGRNVQRLNQLLYSYQDYAVVGRR